MTVIIMIVVIGALLTYATVMGGYILYCFWDWFVLPVFPDLPEINFAQAVGLMLFIGLFKYVSIRKTKDEDAMHNLGMGIIVPIIVLVMGAIIHAIIN